MNYTDNKLLRAPPKTPKKEANKAIPKWKDNTLEDTPEKEGEENMSTSSSDWGQEVDQEIPMNNSKSPRTTNRKHNVTLIDTNEPTGNTM